MKKQHTVFIFFGPPGSGKGTQSEMLGERLKLPVISTGALLRQEETNKTPLGLKAKRFVKKGELVPDKLIAEIIKKRLAKRDTARGFILDGYPRDKVQLDDLLSMVQDKYAIWPVEIKVSDREVLNRLSGRRVCPNCGAGWHLVYKPTKQAGICDVCGHKLAIREDDRPAVVRQRLAGYKETVKDLLAYAKKNKSLISINGEQSIAKVKKDILVKIKKIHPVK
jgi:adenylate kinase